MEKKPHGKDKVKIVELRIFSFLVSFNYLTPLRVKESLKSKSNFLFEKWKVACDNNNR